MTEGGRVLNSEIGPVVVPKERDYAAAKDAEGGNKRMRKRSTAFVMLLPLSQFRSPYTLTLIPSVLYHLEFKHLFTILLKGGNMLEFR